MNSKQQFAEELIKRVEFFNQNPDRDNEATRHDQLIYPFLTNACGLGWAPEDLVSQSTIKIPKHITESHIFRNSIPKLRKPDILICPPGFDKNIAVIEEKQKQSDIAKLNEHRLQTHEYQALYQCTWGVLTDGERWIVKRNFETFHEFSSIYELIQGIDDLKNCLGKSAVIERIVRQNTTDILLIVRTPKVFDSKSSLPADCEIYGFENNIPVIVCGVDNRQITKSGRGYEEFKNLEAALRAFPDLHPRICTKRFTWAMKEPKNGKIGKLRFETWPANDLYSA